MIHLWHTFSDLPEAQQALDRIGQFVDERTSAAARAPAAPRVP
jgi:hypothetical protein